GRSTLGVDLAPHQLLLRAGLRPHPDPVATAPLPGTGAAPRDPPLLRHAALLGGLPDGERRADPLSLQGPDPGFLLLLPVLGVDRGRPCVSLHLLGRDLVPSPLRRKPRPVLPGGDRPAPARSARRGHACVPARARLGWRALR